MAETFSGNEYGPYILEFTAGTDVRPFTGLFEQRYTLDESRQNAVYPRDIRFIRECFRQTMGVLVKRKLENHKEVIIAFTGAYPISDAFQSEPDMPCAVQSPRIPLDQTMRRLAIQLERDVAALPGNMRMQGWKVLGPRRLEITYSTNQTNIESLLRAVDINGFKTTSFTTQEIRYDRPMEIGTTIAIPSADVPNASGRKPDHWLFNVLVPAAVCNLFYLAGDQVGKQGLDFDTMVANIQARLPKIQTRLEALGWQKIANPSSLLIQACALTTTSEKYVDHLDTDEEAEPDYGIFRPRNTYSKQKKAPAPNFLSLEKFYYQLPAAALVNHARLFLDLLNDKIAWSDHKKNKQKIHLEVRVPDDVQDVMYALMGKDFSTENQGVGHVDLRRRIFEPDGIVERGFERYDRERQAAKRAQERQLAYTYA